MSPTSTRFLEAIALHEVEAAGADAAFEAMPQYVPWPKAYGGDAVAQSAAAASRTVASDRRLHSMHGSFLRPVEVGVPVRWEVERLRDGRGYSARHVRGMQAGKTVFLSTLSYTTGGVSPWFAVEAPVVVEPEILPSAADVLAGHDTEAARYWSDGRSFDHRHVPGPVYLSVEGGTKPQQAVWVKSFQPLDDDPLVHLLALAYVCDYTILEAGLRAIGAHWSTPGLMTASLDHSMWFHRPARADEWLLYAQEASSVGDGRGFVMGRFFDRGGELVASVAQEGVISLAPEEGRVG
jgi:acyl-CoA thioesterase II